MKVVRVLELSIYEKMETEDKKATSDIREMKNCRAAAENDSRNSSDKSDGWNNDAKNHNKTAW